MTEQKIGEASTEAERALEAILLEAEPWRGSDMLYRRVHGGYSNSNWRVRVSDLGSYFVKVPGRGTEIFIDRAAAFEASRRAQDLGIGPKTYDYLNHRGVEITDFVDDRRSCTLRDFQSPGIRSAAAGIYRSFHGSGPLGLTKTVFDMIEEHVDQARGLHSPAPGDFAWLYEQYRLARSALEASGIDLAPCVNDPMVGNFLVGGDGSIMLVDYEYASNNDRCYDLGSLCYEMFFSDAAANELLEAYFGRVTPQIRARVVVYGALASLKWSIWAMIQNAISSLDFDFYKYGVWGYMRTRSAMNDPRWVEHLKAI